jgi:ParB family transcriptional regulator, chromosome partitioning protein
MTRQALGKGLEALIPGAKKAQDAKSGVLNVSVADIKANPHQPRKSFSSEKMEEMIKSVKEKGVLQPIILKETGDKYEIVVGERRFIAAVRAGLKSIPAIIKNMSSIEQLEIALVENIHREDLNQVEEANAYKDLMEGMHLTQEQLADKLGKNRSTVTNMLRLLKLPKPVQDYLIRGEIEPGHAKVLLGIEDPSKMKAICGQIVKRGMSVRDLEKMLGREKKTNTPRTKADISEMREIEQKLKHFFGTKAVIKGNDKKGRIEIEYYSQEEFERILEILKIKL